MTSRALPLALLFGLATMSGGIVPAAIAQEAGVGRVTLSSLVQVERTVTDAGGTATTALEDPGAAPVVPGDRLVFTLTYANTASDPATGFVATNPIPAAVAFVEAGEAWATVSTDGGRTWGRLADFTVAEATTGTDGAVTSVSRPASAADVTHVRWAFADPIAPGASGTLTFRGVVR